MVFTSFDRERKAREKISELKRTINFYGLEIEKAIVAINKDKQLAKLILKEALGDERYVRE